MFVPTFTDENMRSQDMSIHSQDFAHSSHSNAHVIHGLRILTEERLRPGVSHGESRLYNYLDTLFKLPKRWTQMYIAYYMYRRPSVNLSGNST